MKDGTSPTRILLTPRSDTVHLSRGRTALGLDRHGDIHHDIARQGLYVYQTRMLSRYHWSMDGELPQLSVQSPVEQHSWLAYYYVAPPNCKQTPSGECNPLQETIELRVARVVGEGMHEDVELTNHTQVATSITLALEVDADFAARKEVKEEKRQQHGKLNKTWRKSGEHEWRWKFNYEAKHAYEHQGEKGVARMQRAIELRLKADSDCTHKGRKISFRIHLEPRATWRACLVWQAEVDGQLLPVEEACNALTHSTGEYARKRAAFLASSTKLLTAADQDLTARVQRVLNRSRLDIAALRMYDLDQGEHDWKLAAGVPTYMAVFGRDLLAAAWQASLLSLDMSRGAVSLLAGRMATDFNDWRDAQPGRMLHEQHTDPLSVLNYTPHGRYFGTATTPFLFPIVVSELWHWTGDADLVRRYIQPALQTLAWADKYSLSESGFYKYQKRSEQGVKNQAWKDSDDAIVYPDGSQVEDPLGTCEMQAFGYAAKLHFSEVLWWLGEAEHATRLYRDAHELKQRFNDRFWMEDENFVAMGIDKDDRLIRTIASDPGHCVTSGILPADRAERVINRLLQPDMFSGWGVRTLSSEHPAYNPFAYHRGTVWPVENAAFVLGMARYGLHGEMWRLSRALFETAAIFSYDRLPEVFGGHSRDDLHPFPCLYEEADSPQAWSASAPILMIQSLLGLYPYAPLNVLFLDPHLPDWLPDITVENFCVGKARVSLRFRRKENGETEFDINSLEGKLHVIRQPSPWSVTADWGERVKDFVSSLLPRLSA